MIDIQLHWRRSKNSMFFFMRMRCSKEKSPDRQYLKNFTPGELSEIKNRLEQILYERMTIEEMERLKERAMESLIIEKKKSIFL